MYSTHFEWAADKNRICKGDVMKKLGLVGGMGPESTIPYYHDIVYGVQNRIGKNFFPNLTNETVNQFEV